MKHQAIRPFLAIAAACLACRAIAAEPALIAYPASTEIPASITLIKKSDKIGRDQAFSSGYRPQLVFSAMKSDVSCTVKVPKPKEQVEPGETAEVVINCIEAFKIIEGKPEFVVLEGGRKVGEGKLLH